MDYDIYIYKLVLVCSTLVFIHFGYISGCSKLFSIPKKNLIEQSSIDAKV